MLNLLNPLFFYVMGSIGVLVPLILHLIQNQRTIKMPFSTIRFLRLAQEKSASRIRMENILLWIIRTCLLVILALAFAMPMLRSKEMGSFFGRSPRDIAIVIDGSYSMDYNLGRSTVWAKAIKTAVAICGGLSEQDRLCVFVARDHVEPVVSQLTGDKDLVVSRLKALAFSDTSSQLAPAVMAANDALDAAKTRHEREIHIITDMQALPWDSFDGGAAEKATPDKEPDKEPDKDADEGGGSTVVNVWDPGKIDMDRSTFFVSLLGAEKPENMSLTHLKIDPSLILANVSSRATVRLGHTGPAKATTLTLWIDDKKVATQSITQGNNQGGEHVFVLPPLMVGWHEVRVEIPNDNLPLDDTFYALLRVADRFPSLCVGSRDDTLFLRAALRAGKGGGGMEADWIKTGGITEDKLANYTCVFLCNALPMSGDEVSVLESFVGRGGLLVVFPGATALPGDYQSWNCLPSLPTGIETLGATKRKAMLHWDARRNAVLKSLETGDSTLSVVVRKRLVWDKLAEDAEPIIRHGEEPFMIGHSYGLGYVLLFSVSADRSWSDFPLSPFYLPIVYQLVEYGAGLGLHPQFVWCADNLPLSRTLPEARHDTVLEAPDGRPVPVRSAMVGVQTVLHVEGIDQAGIYRMPAPGGGGSIPAIAVNMPREESDLTPVDAETLPDRMAVDNVQISRNLDELLVQLEESRVGLTFGEPLLWVVLLLAVVEFVLANRLSQESLKPAQSLGKDGPGILSSPRADGGGA